MLGPVRSCAVSVDVSTPVFEGPFDLLLHLITKEQVDLYEVSLSRIVDAFLHEIEVMESLDLDVATEFLLIAATLVELKLRRLLPERSAVDLDEELALLEERDLLLAKLLEYQTFRGAAAFLRRLERRASQSFPRTNVVEERFLSVTADPLAGSTPEKLREAFRRVVSRLAFPKEVPSVGIDHITPVRVTVGEAVIELAQVLPGLGRSTFRMLTVGVTEPAELIVRFLAVLELYKQGWVELDQARSFGDLHISWQPDGLDRSFVDARPWGDDSGQGGGGSHDDTAESIVALLDDDADVEEVEEIEAELEESIAAARNARLAAGPTAMVDDYDG